MCAGAVLGLAKRAALMRSASASRSENDADNGILPTVPGQFIGAAVSLWPDAQTAESDTHLVEIDAAWVGRVWITYRRVREPRFARWFWSAVRTSQEKNRGTFKKGEKRPYLGRVADRPKSKASSRLPHARQRASICR